MLYHVEPDKTLRVIPPVADRRRVFERLILVRLEHMFEKPRYIDSCQGTTDGPGCMQTLPCGAEHALRVHLVMWAKR